MHDISQPAPVTFNAAKRSDIPAILALLSDDSLGATREGADLKRYEAAFDAIQAEGGNVIIVGRIGGEVIATYQLTFISGLSLRAARRAQIESVRVASHLRGQGVGHLMLADAEARAKAAGCSQLQLTMNTSRKDAHRFYESIGFEPSHVGFKKAL